MEQFKTGVFAVVLGIGFAWASIWITGVGAAVAVPTSLFTPLAQMSGLFAVTLIDLFRIDIPLAAAFLLLVLASKFVVKKPDLIFYLLLLAPFYLQQLYFLLQIQPPLLHLVVMTLPRCLFFAACCYLIVRTTQSAKV